MSCSLTSTYVLWHAHVYMYVYTIKEKCRPMLFMHFQIVFKIFWYAWDSPLATYQRRPWLEAFRRVWRQEFATWQPFCCQVKKAECPGVGREGEWIYMEGFKLFPYLGGATSTLISDACQPSYSLNTDMKCLKSVTINKEIKNQKLGPVRWFSW